MPGLAAMVRPDFVQVAPIASGAGPTPVRNLSGVAAVSTRYARTGKPTGKNAMTFKPAIWYPIALVLSVVNLVAVGFAAGDGEPWHAGLHAGLALAFGLWAQRLRQRPRESELQLPMEALDALEAEVGQLRQELSEAQERLDFTERVLARGPEARRVEPEG